MYLITVLPLAKKARTDILSYFHGTNIPLGTLVEVPFRNKPMRALVTETKPLEDVKGAVKEASYQLRKVSKILANQALTPELVQACKDIGDFYLEPVSKVIDDVIPDILLSEETTSPKLPEKKENAERPYLLCAPTEDRLSWYKTRIRELFAQKKSIYFVFPTEHEAASMHKLLSRGIEEYSVLITGSLSKTKAQTAVAKIQNEEHPLSLFGTASFAVMPRADLDTIVIEHESASSYRRVTAPYIDMRFFIELYARNARFTLVFADTLPRVETYERYVRGELWENTNISFHPDLPENETIISRKKDDARVKFSMITCELEETIKHVKETGSRIFLFTLRNGLASVTTCRDCGDTLTCEFCEAPLALFKNGDKRIFVCNTCKRHTPAESACKRCGSWNLFPHGIGIESVVEECAKQFGETGLFRLDRASIKNDKGAQAVAKQFEETPGSILVGTELALHYLTEKVPYTAVVSFDSLFYIPSFRVSERIVELITSIREKTQKQLSVQTMYPDHTLLSVTSRPRLIEWYEKELAERVEFNYPPHSTLIKVVGHVAKNKVLESKEYLRTTLLDWSPDIYTSPSPEKKDFVRLIALIRVPKTKWWFSLFTKDANIDQTLKETLRGIQEYYAVFVNPEDLL